VTDGFHDVSRLAQAYRILGVERWASDQELKQRYRDLARVWHPDRFATDARMRVRAEEELKSINAAFDLVKSERAHGARPPHVSYPAGPTVRPMPRTGWLCPDCGNPVSKGDRWCEVCCRRLSFEQDPPRAERTGWSCPDCGGAVRKGDWRCRKCGRRLTFDS
jgi:hypothetical protein